MVKNVKEVLKLIDQNIANLNGTRDSHADLQEVIVIIQNLIVKTIDNAKLSKKIEKEAQ